MNRKTMKMLLTGKKPRLPVRKEQVEAHWPRVIRPIKLDPTLSKYSDAYAELRDIILQGLGVPAHLVR